MHFFNPDSVDQYSPYEVPPGNLYQPSSYFGKLKAPPVDSDPEYERENAYSERSESFKHSHSEPNETIKESGLSQLSDKKRNYSIDAEGKYITKPRTVDENLEIINIDAEQIVGLNKRQSLAKDITEENDEVKAGTKNLEDILKKYKTKKPPVKKSKETELHKIRFKRDKPI